MNHDEKLLYNFFIQIMKTKPDVSFPISFLTMWQECRDGLVDAPSMDHPEKEELLNAWNKAGISVNLNKVIYEAIKTIREMKASEENDQNKY